MLVKCCILERLRKMKERNLKRLALFLFGVVAAMLVELLGFNYRYWLSLGNDPYVQDYRLGSGLTVGEDGSCTIEDNAESYIEFTGINNRISDVFFDVVCYDADGAAVPAELTLQATDEGHAEYYRLGKVTTYPTAPKSEYVRLHTYGELKDLRIELSAQGAETVKIGEIILDARVPLIFSVGRCITVFLVMFIAWAFRPGSLLYRWKAVEDRKGKTELVAVVLLLNTLFFAFLVQLNETFMHPPWMHHAQYRMLAESLVEGRTDLMIDPVEALDNMDNPYDSTLRSKVAAGAPWDIAYYEGKFYVYFGLVPELLFYLPCLLITGRGFPNFMGILICAVAVLYGAFYLMKKIIKRWFPQTSFGAYLLLSLIVANGMGTVQMLLDSRFYCLPVIMALAFTVWGLGFWIGAADSWQSEQAAGIRKIKTGSLLCAGSLCMALVAGCRPQFLVGSFFCTFLFRRLLKGEEKLFCRSNIKKVCLFALPYIAVAAVLMYYNYVRFDSPFDFGANYNLTTNDMTSRGVDAGRIPDGLFMYFFQLPNITRIFPFVQAVGYSSGYVGQVIRETMYGGVLFTHIFVWAMALFRGTKNKLKEKGLLLWSAVSLGFSLVVAVVNTQMAGILSRYYCDFIWLLFLPAVFVALQFLENTEGKKKHRWFLVFLLITFFTQLFMDFFIGFNAANTTSYMDGLYYRVMNWFL